MSGGISRARARYEIVQGADQAGAETWHVRLVARNNEILSTSETYPTRAAATKNIDAQTAAHAHICHSADPIEIRDVIQAADQADPIATIDAVLLPDAEDAQIGGGAE